MLAHTCYLTDARIRREAEALAGNGVEVHVVSLMEEIRAGREPREAIHNGVHIHRLHIRCHRRIEFSGGKIVQNPPPPHPPEAGELPEISF